MQGHASAAQDFAALDPDHVLDALANSSDLSRAEAVAVGLHVGQVPGVEARAVERAVLARQRVVVLPAGERADAADARVHASAVAYKILSALGEPYELQGTRHVTTPSIGVTLFHSDAHTHIELLRQADAAMYAAKAKGRNTLEFFA